MAMFGRRNSAARKLDVLEVQKIRKRYEEGETQASIGRAYGMSTVQIGRIVRGESWVTGAGKRGASPMEADEVLRHLMEVQAQVDAGLPPPGLLAAAQSTQAPPSPLDGGDAPDETQGGGSQALLAKAREFGAGGGK